MFRVYWCISFFVVLSVVKIVTDIDACGRWDLVLIVETTDQLEHNITKQFPARSSKLPFWMKLISNCSSPDTHLLQVSSNKCKLWLNIKLQNRKISNIACFTEKQTETSEIVLKINLNFRWTFGKDTYMMQVLPNQVPKALNCSLRYVPEILEIYAFMKLFPKVHQLRSARFQM